MAVKRHRLAAAWATATLALCCSLPAAADMALARKSNCTACHAVDRKLVGPAYRDVAKKHAADKDAVARLAASIRAGGAGRWGPMAMPAQPGLSEANARKLAAWILAGSPD